MRQGPLPKTGAQYLEECIPGIFDQENVLYVGATAKRQLLVPEFTAHGAAVDLLEIWEQNIQDILHSNDPAVHLFRHMVQGDVRQLAKYLEPANWWNQYGVICWWHGPEHVEKTELPATLKLLASYADNWAICACPWGRFPQGPEAGNIYETHLSELGPEDFVDLGWKSRGFGERDDPWSYVIAWTEGWKRSKHESVS